MNKHRHPRNMKYVFDILREKQQSPSLQSDEFYTI